MNTLLIGINAKYIHSNLAIRYLMQYAQAQGLQDISLAEYTINQRLEQISASVYRQKPDLLGISCYIWNYDYVKKLVPLFKKILPETTIFLGGPEVSYEPETALRETGADLVIAGEGEQIFAQLLKTLQAQKPIDDLRGIVYRSGGQVIHTPPAEPLDMDTLPFVYQDLSELEYKILYFESSRGCPFQCQYCLSCNDNHVRFMSLPNVYKALDFFLAQRVRQVKFVDRTFNCNRDYAMSIWRYLKEHDNGCTNFHFEIAAELLDEPAIAFLNTVRRGQFQFEIGVQSTNPDTLKHIKRITKLDVLQSVVHGLQKENNIHLHLDLIIGLPEEGYRSFARSFNDVYALRPDQLQVGFLKVLKGSGLYRNCKDFGIAYNSEPPYEVLYTSVLTYDEILKLKMVEEMVELYYNSNRFQKTVAYLLTFFPNPFSFYEALAQYYEAQGYHERSHTNVGYYDILFEFFRSLGQGDETRFQWYAKFDLYSHEKARKLPAWLTVDMKQGYRQQIRTFYESEENRKRYLPEYAELEPKQLERVVHIELFPFCPDTMQEQVTPVLFHYRACDLLGNAARYSIHLKD